MRTAAWIVVGAVFCAAAAPPARAADHDQTAYSSLLHDARFAAAVEKNAAAGDDVERRFLAAFITWWRLVFDDDNLELQALFEHQLNGVVAAEDDDTLLWSGNAHLLLAQLRAWQKRPMAAAFEAKKAKKTLEEAVRDGAQASDAYFGLGTYNYMADALPSFVKGLRALLFIPAGNRERGIEQLETAARESPHFAFEARILLITLYAQRHEQQYARALEQRDLLLQAAPDAIASLYASARLDISLGRNDAAIAALTKAAERAATLRDVDPVVLRSIDLLRARAEFGALRPDRARATAHAALASGNGLTASITRDLLQIEAAAQKLAEGIDWKTIPADAGHLIALADAAPERPVLALIAGDAQLRQGKPGEAITLLERAANGPLPPAVKAGCQLRQGQAADLMGDRAKAIEYYKRAADTPGFAAKDAAVFYQQAPFRAGA
ncbi:MAG TPA: hypothetical protein VFV19_14595 [Candidatus Polarisedimenticolaceae bacterium]|nr:hypothetical protein [Candidatus Polarisedimenticolaceae bacterium]